MSDVVREVQSQPGYYLPEGAQYRLQQLRDHMRFLARVAQPRTQAEERARQPDICMDELAVCLELLAEQLGGVAGRCGVRCHGRDASTAMACCAV